MAIRTYKPTSPARRFMSVLTYEEITKKSPEKSLVEYLKKNAGRNKQGKITVRHQGGGNKGHKAPLHSSLHGLLLSFRSVQSVQHGHLLLLSRGDLIKHPAQVKVIHGIPPPELLSVFSVPGPARCGQ